jgi:hypothetical protein
MTRDGRSAISAPDPKRTCRLVCRFPDPGRIFRVRRMQQAFARRLRPEQPKGCAINEQWPLAEREEFQRYCGPSKLYLGYLTAPPVMPAIKRSRNRL